MGLPEPTKSERLGSDAKPAELSDLPKAGLRTEIRESVLVPPEYVKTYDAIAPDLARKVIEHNLKAQDFYIQELIKQQANDRKLDREHIKHTHRTETTALKAAVEDLTTSRKLQSRGQWIATAVTLAGLAVVTAALFTDHESAATWLGCSMVVALAGVTFAVRLLPDRPDPGSPPTPTDTPG